jgi:hypothetical protein
VELGPCGEGDGSSPLLGMVWHLLSAKAGHEQGIMPPGGWTDHALRLLSPLLAALAKYVPAPGQPSLQAANPDPALTDLYCVQLLGQLSPVAEAARQRPQLAVALACSGYPQLALRLADRAAAASDTEGLKKVVMLDRLWLQGMTQCSLVSMLHIHEKGAMQPLHGASFCRCCSLLCRCSWRLLHGCQPCTMRQS